MEQIPLVTTYVRYKRGTQKLITWLSESARSAREAKTPAAYVQLPKKRAAPPSPAPIRITAAELVPLAQAIIAATDPKIEIPLDILDVAQDVITGRKRCCEWYTALAKDSRTAIPDVIESNRKHCHFLAILEDVFLLLRREAKGRLPKRKKKMTFSTNISHLTNLYEHLELEEPVDVSNSAAHQASKPSTHDKKKRRTAEAAYELDNGEEELLFMIWSHFNDQLQIRLQARKSWQQYTSGEISFEAACHTANNAMILACRLADQFSETHKDLDTFKKILAVIGEENYAMSARVSSTVAMLFPPSDMDESEAHLYSLCNNAEFLCMPAWCAMNDVLDLSDIFLRSRKQLEITDPRSMWPGHPFSKALLNVVGDLFQVLGDPCANNRKDSPYFTADTRSDLILLGDEYTQQLLDMMMFERINVGILACTQMYIDIYDILGGDLARGSRTSLVVLERLHSAWDDFNEGMCSGEGVLQIVPSTAMETLLGGARRILKPDQSNDGREGWTICPEILRSREQRPDTFILASIMDTLPLLPMRCTSMLIDHYQNLSVKIINGQRLMLASAHIYRAAKLQGSVNTEWPDMEFVLRHQHQVVPLVRDGNGTILTAAKQYSMALGLTLTQVSKPSRPPCPKQATSFKKSVKLKYGSHYWNIFWDGFRAAYSLNHRWRVDQYTFYQCIKSYASTASGIKDDIIAKQWKTTQKLNPAQVLQTLQEVFVSEEPHVHFNYLELMQHCVTLLGYAAHAYYESISDPIARTKPDELVYRLAHEVLWDAADVESGGAGQRSTVLWKCGIIMQRIIDKSGDVSLRNALEISSGTLPPDSIPSVLYRPDSLGVQTRAAVAPKLIIKEAAYDVNEETVPKTEEEKRWVQAAEEAKAQEESDLEKHILTEAAADFSRLTSEGMELQSAVTALQTSLGKRLAGTDLQKMGVVEMGEGEVVITTRPMTEDDFYGKMVPMKNMLEMFKTGIRLLPPGHNGRDAISAEDKARCELKE